MKFFYSTIFIILFFLPSYAKNYRILVLPCGGATSIMNALLLDHIEKETGMPIAKLFDEIWGASAGSIIAALLTSPHATHKSAAAIVQLFDTIFANYHTAYFVRETARSIIGSNTPIKHSSIPVRILTAVSHLSQGPFKPYDFSSDGKGNCVSTNIPLATIVAASCTVYPYLFRSPIRIAPDRHTTHYCIDPGSLGCQPSIIDPTAYFLEQFLPRLMSHDTLTIYFLGNAFTQSLDYEDVYNVLEKNNLHHSWAIRYQEGSFDPYNRAQIEIVNIPVTTSSSSMLNKYLTSANFFDRIQCKIVAAIFDRIMGKENGAPNMLAAGVISSSILKKEAQNIINTSVHFKTMLRVLSQ